jgi:glutathione S-transferase
MSDSVPRLTYFVFRGLGEPIRLVFEDLALPYHDHRLTFEDWDPLKPTLPFRQVPALEIDGRGLVQCHAILRYLARKHALYGDGEDARIRADITADAFRDAQTRLWDHFWSPGSDAPDAAAAFEAGPLPAILAPLEAWLGGAAHFGGAQPSFADYYAVTCLDEAAAFFPKAMDTAPRLASFRRRMAERPGIAAYIASGRQPKGYGFDPIRNIREPPAA